jgi:hypothetical protein
MHTGAHVTNMLDAMKTEALSLKCGMAMLSFSPKPKHEPELPNYYAHEARTFVDDDETKIEQSSRDARVSIDPVAPGDLKRK